jgi:hypothetical protein
LAPSNIIENLTLFGVEDLEVCLVLVPYHLTFRAVEIEFYRGEANYHIEKIGRELQIEPQPVPQHIIAIC